MYLAEILVFIGVLCTADASVCSGGRRWVADPTDCSSFWMCLPFMSAKYKCPGDTVTNQYMEACVPKGSHMDVCSKKATATKKTTLKMLLSTASSPVKVSTAGTTRPSTTTSPPTTTTTILPTTSTTPTTTTTSTTTTRKTTTTLSSIESLCKDNPSEVIAHPDDCSSYIDCSQVNKKDEGVAQCPYPLLWNQISKRCEHHDLTACGQRYEPVDPCEYKKNQCNVQSHCVPCEVRFPSCRGLQDGLQAWKGRENTPYFVVCRGQRLVHQGKCTYEEKAGVVFDPRRKTCVTR